MTAPRIEDAHPLLRDAWPKLRADYERAVPGFTLALGTVLRTPAEQFELYKKGRVARDSEEPGKIPWEIVDKAQILTNVDGYRVVGKHNKTPSEAIDVVAFKLATGRDDWRDELYFPLGELAEKYGLVWGGSWHTIKDLDHLETPKV